MEDEVFTKLVDKHASPLVIRKYTHWGFPLYVGMITDDGNRSDQESSEAMCGVSNGCTELTRTCEAHSQNRVPNRRPDSTDSSRTTVLLRTEGP